MRSPLARIEYGDIATAKVSIIFIHGWLDNAASFSRLMEKILLTRDDLHLCAFDLPGHGYSMHKGEYYFYPFHDYLDDLNQVLAEFKQNPCILVGHSLGGLIASCYSAAFPEKVQGLIQIEGKGPLSEPPEMSVVRLRKGLENRERMRKKTRKGYPSFTKALAHRSKSSALSESLVEPIVRRGLVEDNGYWYWCADPKLSCQSLFRMSHEHAQEIVDHIECPYAIILGESGYEHLKSTSAIRLKKDVVVETVVGGHHCHIESPDAVNNIIQDLVRRVVLSHSL
ncbi:alpha/beta hydrolase [Vibrio sp.]|nr:alpha/beta hydrolase [Vibrio sp.]